VPKPVVVIGINANDPYCMEQKAKECLQQADQIWGTERHLQYFNSISAQKVVLRSPIISNLQSLRLRDENETIVILAGGDPNFFGLGSSLYKILPPQEVLIFPQPTVLQHAFAKVHLTWEDALFTSVHARSLSELIGLVKRFPKVGVLTDPTNTPGKICEELAKAGIDDCTVFVLEKLGTQEEKITKSSLMDIIECQFDPLNVMLIVREKGWKPDPIPIVRSDESYFHREGMITKADIRLISLQRLHLSDSDIVWDIGAGSGAMSIEIAEIVWRGEVYAIEHNQEQLDYLNKNINRYNLLNIHVIHGRAPEVLIELPDPDAVFIGGSGGSIIPILDWIEKKGKDGCRIVCHFVILENLFQAFDWMKENDYRPQLTHVHLAYGKTIANGTRFIPINPVYILCGRKGKVF